MNAKQQKKKQNRIDCNSHRCKIDNSEEKTVCHNTLRHDCFSNKSTTTQRMDRLRFGRQGCVVLVSPMIS